MNLWASGIPRKQPLQLSHTAHPGRADVPFVIRSECYQIKVPLSEEVKGLAELRRNSLWKCLASNPLFFKSKDCQLSGICWLQLSRCHPEGKVSPRWLNTRTSNTDTAHAAETSDCCIYFTLLVGKQRIQVSFKSSSALEEKEQKEDKNLFSKRRIISCFLCLKNRNWCFLECQKAY